MDIPTELELENDLKQLIEKNKEYFYLCLFVRISNKKFYVKNAFGSDLQLTVDKKEAFQGGLATVTEIKSIVSSYFNINVGVENVWHIPDRNKRIWGS